jgi:hypothetical protein
MSGITQNVTGSHNALLGVEGDFYHLEFHLPQPPPRDWRKLKTLLARMRLVWVTNMLERAVALTPAATPRMQGVPDRVERPAERLEKALGDQQPADATGSDVGRFFAEAGGTLLILGEPGAGKTVALLTLAREAADRAGQDLRHPVPVVLNLASWAEFGGTLHEWIVAQVGGPYHVGEAGVARWLKQNRLLLLLDGLDEVAPARRAACVDAIHAFAREHGAAGMAVSCRAREYGALPTRLSLGGAVQLLPLSAEQVEACLREAGPAASGLRTAIEADADLGALATSPLMLNLMIAAFGGVQDVAAALSGAPTREALRDRVFAAYVNRMFEQRARPEVPRARVERWLRWLAAAMTRRQESIFAAELLQPASLTPNQIRAYTYLSRMGGGVAVTAVFGGAASLGMYLFVLGVQAAIHKPLSRLSPREAADAVLGWVVGAGVMGLAGGLLYAVVDGRRLRRPTVPARSVSIFREVTGFIGYIGPSAAAALLAWLVAAAARIPPNAPAADAMLLTVVASIFALPLCFRRTGGRGMADGDIRLAGTLSWNWGNMREGALVTLIVGGVAVALARRLGVSRSMMVGVVLFGVLIFLAYQSWIHEVPPVEQWSRGRGRSTLIDSGKAFAMGGVCWIAVLYPLLRFAVAPGAPTRLLLLIAVFSAPVLVIPALFWFGGLDLVLHYALRVVLARAGALPLRLRRFLDYAVHLGFLQRAGGGYAFIHPLLKEHFAAPPDDPAA